MRRDLAKTPTVNQKVNEINDMPKRLNFMDININILRMCGTTVTRAFRKDVSLPVAEFQRGFQFNARVYSLILTPRRPWYSNWGCKPAG
jgi:hypothetical protein